MEGPRHDTVLLEESVDALEIAPSDVVVDGTIGGAGHFSRMLGMLDKTGTLIGIDADADAINRARAAAKDVSARVELVQDNFRNLATILDERGVSTINKSLFDLGWSGFQLSAQRGFSFQKNEPLLMTYGKDEAHSAAAIVNTASEEELSDILHTYGEERFARPIARAIVRIRQQSRILTTADLVHAVEEGTPAWYQHRRVHPATKTFQALRIATNDELGALRDVLNTAIERTAEGGRIAVITFHSIEDRIVKTMFRDAAYAGKGMVITRKPITPSDTELAANRRARSAKLRVFACGVSATPTPITHSHTHLYV